MRRWHPNAILDEIDFAPGVLRRHSGPAVVDRDEANRDGKRKHARPHEITRTRYRRMPAAQQAARVGIIPALKRKIATVAATDSASAHRLTLASTGASNASGPARTATVSRNTVWTANQMARFRTTPTTAAVIADMAAFRALLPLIVSTNGAPRKIHRKHGINVTQVASRPPSVPASIGESAPGSRYAAMKPTNCRTMMRGPGVVSAMPRPSSISPGLSQP